MSERNEISKKSSEKNKEKNKILTFQALKMLYDAELHCHVVVPVDNLEKGELVTKSMIATRLLNQLLTIRATENCGYFLSVTKLRSIESGILHKSSTFIVFPVNFCCRIFLPQVGETMIGTVYSMHKRGVLIKCGPMNHIYLSMLKMPNYHYVDGEHPIYLSNDLSRIEKDGVICFKVFAIRWRNDDASRQFKILATIEGDGLGPISSAGSDGIDFWSIH